MTSALILPLQSEAASLAVAGGKGANLAHLTRAGFPVPPGFVVTTAAYRAYVAANRLDDFLAATLRPLTADDPADLEKASAAIRVRFAAGVMPPELAGALREAYAALGSPPVAVRSSATFEDLPDLSFAGLQDTYLQVAGAEELLRRVAECLGSLWTARAIGYRARNGLPHQEAALAVVVQEMVPAEVAGVLFTANPLTGKRSEIVIDAALGLGEALVSGRVEPDHYVVDGSSGRLLGKRLGAKALSIRGQEGGGTAVVAEDAAGRQGLPDDAILALADLGRRAARLFGTPQDVEWAWAAGRLFVLQSRPITSLYPQPEGVPAEPLRVLLSYGAVQGVLDPFTPLGRDMMRMMCALWINRTGGRVNEDTQQMLLVAGERLFLDMTSRLRNPLARRWGAGPWAMVDPVVGRILEGLWDDPRLKAAAGPRGADGMGLANFTLVAARVPYFFLWPDAGREWCLARVEAHAPRLARRAASARTLADRLRLLPKLTEALFAPLMGCLMPAVLVGFGSLYLLHRLAAGLPDGGSALLEVTRGLPHNVTSAMDLALWETACRIRADAASAAAFEATPAATLAGDYRAGRLPEAAQTAVAAFLRRYGMRGLAEIDLGRPRWREEPTMVLQTLQSYLRITNPEQAPDRVFARGAAAAEAALTRLTATLRRTRWGWLKAPLARWAGRRLRALGGLRESPKFFLIRMYGLLRDALLDSGRQLVAGGILDRADDLFFLHLSEFKAVAAGDRRDWKALVAERRSAYAREKRRRQIPRVLLSDGQAFYEGAPGAVQPGPGVLLGTPVSPGVAEGPVRVLVDPAGAQLLPGEILVCPGTDPSWTPLFLAAGGLVTEVGGLITHGSVVAREYGIPAVVGVHEATTRLKTGQRVRLDGTSGQVTLLDGAG